MRSPIQRFLALESASGVVLLAVAVVALAWANSPWAGAYHALWHGSLGAVAGTELTLHLVVNDGLMTIFFFVVGLEIRREIHEGELSELRRAALPLAAALGGMLAPAAIYAVFNAGHAGRAGWGVPMATDIAFAVGVLTLLGRRASPALRILLLALAVIDDLGAIVVIAIFYTGGLGFAWLGLVAGAIGAIVVMRRLGIAAPLAYVVPGAAMWFGLFRTGIHPTLAGVVLGLMTPVVARPGAHAPSGRLLDSLHGWVAFGVMPLFALANAGVAVGGASLGGDHGRIFAGVVLGLILGKPIGVFLVSRALIATGGAVRPRHVADRGLLVVGMLAGIGFTMALFVAQLAFPPGAMLETAKLAILVASGGSIVIGWLSGTLLLRPPVGTLATEDEAERSTEL